MQSNILIYFFDFFLPFFSGNKAALMFGSTPPAAMIAFPKNWFSSSSFRTASWMWRGIIRIDMDLNSIRATQLLFFVLPSRDKQAQGNKKEYCAASLIVRELRGFERALWLIANVIFIADMECLIAICSLMRDEYWYSLERMNECICAHVQMSSGFIISERNVWGRKRNSKNLPSPFSLSADQVSFCQLISKEISSLLEFIAIQILFFVLIATRTYVFPFHYQRSSNVFLHDFNTTLSCQWHRRQNSFQWPITFCMIHCWKWSSNWQIVNVLKTEAFSCRETITARAVPQYYYLH